MFRLLYVVFFEGSEETFSKLEMFFNVKIKKINDRIISPDSLLKKRKCPKIECIHKIESQSGLIPFIGFNNTNCVLIDGLIKFMEAQYPNEFHDHFGGIFLGNFTTKLSEIDNPSEICKYIFDHYGINLYRQNLYGIYDFKNNEILIMYNMTFMVSHLQTFILKK